MNVAYSSIFCLFGFVFVAVLALGILNQIGVLNRRVTGAIAVLVVLPLTCAVVLFFMLSVSQMGGPLPGGPGIWP